MDFPIDSIFAALTEVGIGGEASLANKPRPKPIEEGTRASRGGILGSVAAFWPGFEESFFGCGANEKESFAGASEGDIKEAGFFGDEFFSLLFFAKPVRKGGIGLSGARELKSPA